MESRDSSYSLSSRRLSGAGSGYVVESGVYVSSFAATVLVAALIAIGILLLTLVVALAMMLESCQKTNSGVFERTRIADQYEYCKFFALHAELNNLEEMDYPMICKQEVIQVFNESKLLKDLIMTVQVVKSYFSTLRPYGDGLDVILIDLDDIFSTNVSNDISLNHLWDRKVDNVKRLSTELIVQLIMKLKSGGWSLRFFTRKPSREANATIPSFASTGYAEYSSLIMRYNALLVENYHYVSSVRVQLQNEGFRIASIISCRMDAFQGPALGRRNFKLACPTYDKSIKHDNRARLSER